MIILILLYEIIYYILIFFFLNLYLYGVLLRYILIGFVYGGFLFVFDLVELVFVIDVGGFDIGCVREIIFVKCY